MSKWAREVQVGDIFYNEDLEIEDIANQIANRFDAVLASGRNEFIGGSFDVVLAERDEFVELKDLISELREEAKDAFTFDLIWDAIYDEADYCRVWIDLSTNRKEED